MFYTNTMLYHQDVNNQVIHQGLVALFIKRKAYLSSFLLLPFWLKHNFGYIRLLVKSLNPLDASLSPIAGLMTPVGAILLASMRWNSCSLYFFRGHWTMLIETLRLNSSPVETDSRQSHIHRVWTQSSVSLRVAHPCYRLNWVCQLMGGMVTFELSWSLLGRLLLLAPVASPPPSLIRGWSNHGCWHCRPLAPQPQTQKRLCIPPFPAAILFLYESNGSSSSKLMTSVPWSFVLSRRGASGWSKRPGRHPRNGTHHCKVTAVAYPKRAMSSPSFKLATSAVKYSVGCMLLRNSTCSWALMWSGAFIAVFVFANGNLA